MDSYTKSGALRLASIIQIYWATQGANVEVWIEPIVGLGGDLYQVKSNIAEKLNGASNSHPMLRRPGYSSIH